MRVPENVKPLPFPVSYIFRGCAFGNLVFIRKSILNDLKKNNPSPFNVGVLLHELEHIKRIKKPGKWKYAWKFWTSSEFRFQEEIAANTPQMKHIKNHGAVYDIEKRARQLNGPIYLWCASYEKAKSKLESLWKRL